jgi:hypothetical protein
VAEKQPPTPIAPDFITQLRELQSPASVIFLSVNDDPTITKFTTGDTVQIYYLIKGIPADKPVYFSLFNISSTGELNRLLFNQATSVGELQTYPATQATLKPGEEMPLIVAKLSLETGQEYFQALVTANPLSEQFFNAAKSELQKQKFWGTQKLTVTVTE